MPRETIVVKILKKDQDVKTPQYMTPGSAGCDVCCDEDVLLLPGERLLIRTGLFMQIPDGYECQLRPRSGLALKHGITVLNSPGTIDSDYRGENCVLLHNTSSEIFEAKKGTRIAQFVFAPVVIAEFQEVEELSETERGAGGYGSTKT